MEATRVKQKLDLGTFQMLLHLTEELYSSNTLIPYITICLFDSLK